MKQPLSDKKIKITILDQTGDTTLEQFVDETVETIAKQFYTRGRFPYLNTVFFPFSAKSLSDKEALDADLVRLKQALSTEDDVVVTLTGALVGGKVYTSPKPIRSIRARIVNGKAVVQILTK